MSAVSVSAITPPFRPLRDYCSLSPYALSAITLPFRLTPSLRLLFPSTKNPIPRFCAREGRKWGSRRVKAHKIADFVLERGQNLGKVALSDTKTPILCSGRGGLAPGREEISFGKHNNGLPANHRARFQNINI